MPTYLYACSCGTTWDVIKRVADIENIEGCPACRTPGERQIARVNFNGAADWNEQTFNPALGCYTRSTAHARKLAKEKGMEEVGTEAPEKIHAKFARDKAETHARRWADDREKLYD